MGWRVSLTLTERKDLLQRMLALLDQHYVFPDVARSVRTALETDLADGVYERLESDADFCAAVTERMKTLANDKHLRLRPRDPNRPMFRPDAGPELLAEIRQGFADQNNGFAKVERLAGNVGYLDVRMLVPTEFGGDTAAAAMNFLANSAALIIDLRQSPGGSPSMVNLLCSYLFDGMPVHLNTLEWRDGDSFQSWTMPYVPGRRLAHVPVWLLTSSFTFSGAEELTYNLKCQKRATVVGEVTGGGANPGGAFPLTETIEVFVPRGRAVNPVTGDNWEGKGITPDVPVPASEAFQTAYGLALRHVVERCRQQAGDPAAQVAREAEEALAALSK